MHEKYQKLWQAMGGFSLGLITVLAVIGLMSTPGWAEEKPAVEKLRARWKSSKSRREPWILSLPS